MAGATAEIHSALLTARLMGDLGGQGHRGTRDSFLTLARLSAPGHLLPLAAGSFRVGQPHSVHLGHTRNPAHRYVESSL